MANASRDENRVPTLLAVSDADGFTPVVLWADPVTHRLLVDLPGGGTISGSGTVNEITYWTGASTLGSLAVATYPSLTELSYVKGVTSAIQTQLNAKLTSANIEDSIVDGHTTIAPSGNAVFDALALKAPLASPTLTGTPAAPTPTAGDSTTKIATTAFVQDAITTAVVGLLDYRGSYDASSNLFPATGGSGIAGAILKGDFWICSVAGTLGGVGVTAGDLIIALQDTPGQTAGNWDLVQHDVNNEYVTKALYDANTILYATTDNTPVALTVGEQTVVGRATGGAIAALAIDSDLSSVSANDDTVPSAKATKAMGDLKLPLAGGTMTGKLVSAGSAEVAKTYAPASGSQTVTIDCSVNNFHEVTGNSGGTAITFAVSNATNSQCFMVSITQGASTLTTIAGWFATVRWVGGTPPTLTATANKRDTFGFRRTGANTYDGFVIGQNI